MHIVDRDSENVAITRNGTGSRRGRAWLFGVAWLIGVATSASAAANPDPAALAQIVHARRDHFHALGKATKSLREQIGRANPDWALVASDTTQIGHLAAALPTWFPAGSGRGHGIKTKARAKIWAQPQAFAAAARTLSTRAQDLAQAVASHDRRTLELRARALGQACGTCHHRFRAHSNWW